MWPPHCYPAQSVGKNGSKQTNPRTDALLFPARFSSTARYSFCLPLRNASASDLLNSLTASASPAFSRIQRNNRCANVPPQCLPFFPSFSIVMRYFVVGICLLAAQCLGATFDAIASLATTQYDFVVVGGMSCDSHFVVWLNDLGMVGGTAGLVVANRLSEDPGTSVLVIEAGVS